MSNLPSKPQLGLHDMFLMFPDHAVSIVKIYDDVMRGPSELSAGERELVYAYAVALQGCYLPYHSHMAAAVELGVDPEIPRRLIDDFEGALLPPRLRALLAYARQLAVAPGTVGRQDAEAVFAAGASEAALIDVARICALSGWISRMVCGLGVGWSAESQRERGRVIASAGYKGILAGLSAHLAKAAHGTGGGS